MNKPPEQTSPTTEMSSVEILHELAKTLGSRPTTKRVLLRGGITLTHRLRAVYRKHKIEILGNQNLIVLHIEASYGEFELLVIDERLNRSGFLFGPPARTFEVAGVKHQLGTIDGNLTQSQSTLYESGVLRWLLEVIEPQVGEEINVSQRLVRIYLRSPTKSRVMAIVDAVIELMPHETGDQTQIEFDSFPDALRPLIPLIAQWAISDDEERSRKLMRSAESTRQRLVNAVVPLLPLVDQFLDTFGRNPPEEACALGDLAQAAIEAQLILGKSAVR